ncbi:hypothetical protein NQ318_018755 [Aromia moschata]|uniref:PH domain-containing protein n=1 Tax=Aromia moschata TaxID=1265417 RepID=A0AAV8ZHQ4_9CUCU|nr:hypothetical protein NQ318_018755 [Aromia moschata]
MRPNEAWQKQWCEIRRLDSIENGIELQLKSIKDGSVLSCVVLPRSSTICRTDSRTKQYAFGVFNLGRNKKPILFMSGVSESDSQEWIAAMRRMLSVASYIPGLLTSIYWATRISECLWWITAIREWRDWSDYSGVLNVNSQEILISDPCTGDPKITWKRFHFHQFHHLAPAHLADEKKVIRVSGWPRPVAHLLQGGLETTASSSQGKSMRASPGIISSKRLSRSEGDLCFAFDNTQCLPDSPICFRSQSESEDSGVRVSVSSDDSDYTVMSKNESGFHEAGLALITKTPGGSESEGSAQDLADIEEETEKGKLPRRESGVSLASGIYEEIPDDHSESFHNKASSGETSHVYENPLELILGARDGKYFKPPPLPPRRLEFFPEGEERRCSYKSIFLPFKQRCNTMPAKDLSKLSQIFTTDSEYVVMSPSKTLLAPKKASLLESFYVPMSPVINLKNKLVEGYYMTMTAKRS